MAGMSNTQKDKEFDSDDIRFMIARRPVDSSATPFKQISTNDDMTSVDGKVQLAGLKQLDGEYVVLVSMGDSQDQDSGQGRKNTSMISAAGSQTRVRPGVFAVTALVLVLIVANF